MSSATNFAESIFKLKKNEVYEENKMITQERYRIYVVEDDGMLADEICRLLMKWGYEVRIAEMFDNILDEFLTVKPHVVLMDVNIPSFDGFYWCKKIRDISAVPIIYISSRDSSMDVIMGMKYSPGENSGGDYISGFTGYFCSRCGIFLSL